MRLPASETRPTMTTLTPNLPHARRPPRRHDLSTVLPELASRIRAGEFATLDEVAAAFGIDKATASRWKDRAVAQGLIDARTWRYAFLDARLAREVAA